MRPGKPEAPRHTIKAVRRRDNNTCAICGAPGNEVDHITPTSQGGTHHPTNLRVLCHTCHTRKTANETRHAVRRKQTTLKLPQEQHPGIL